MISDATKGSGTMNAPTLPQSFPNPVKVEEVRTRADYLAEARVRQAGAGFSSPFLTVSDEELARADVMIGYRLDKHAQARDRAAFQAKWAAIAAEEKMA
jgi:hypothetical protein